MNETLQRIEQVIDLYGTTKTTLAHKIGMAQSTLSSIFIRGNQNAIPPLADAILGIYADVRREWLVEGQEPMLYSQLRDDGTSLLIQTITNLSETVRQQQETIRQLTKTKTE